MTRAKIMFFAQIWSRLTWKSNITGRMTSRKSIDRNRIWKKIAAQGDPTRHWSLIDDVSETWSRFKFDFWAVSGGFGSTESFQLSGLKNLLKFWHRQSETDLRSYRRNPITDMTKMAAAFYEKTSWRCKWRKGEWREKNEIVPRKSALNSSLWQLY